MYFSTLTYGAATAIMAILTATSVSILAQPRDLPSSEPEPRSTPAAASSANESSVAPSDVTTESLRNSGVKQISAQASPGGSWTTRPTPLAKQASSDNDWKFGFAPYLFAAGIRGTIGANGRSVNVDASFGDVWERLEFGVMGTFEARKGRFVTLTDAQWIKLSAARESPGGLYSGEKVTVNLYIIDPQAGVRVASGKAGSFDILGGVRIWRTHTDLDVRTGILPGFEETRARTFAAPVVGFHGVLNVTSKLFLSTKMDVGAAGNVKSTWQIYAGGGFRITKKAALIGGYRSLRVNYDDSPEFIFDTTMSGLLFGARFDL